MTIKVLGEGCDKCTQLYENTKAAVAELGLEVEVEKVTDLIEIVRLGVMTSPSLMVDGKLVVSGQVASAKTIARLLRK
jgi:small redox-active disulfide protein 2